MNPPTRKSLAWRAGLKADGARLSKSKSVPNAQAYVEAAMHRAMLDLRDQRNALRMRKQTSLDHLKSVLRFPNIQNALAIISAGREVEMKRFGFLRLKSMRSLVKREVLRMRREEKAMSELEKSLRRREEEAKHKHEEERKETERVELEKHQQKIEKEEREREEEVLKQEQERLLFLSMETKRDAAVVTIQRCIRGYMSRGIVKDMYRKRLLLELKVWGNGQTSSLLNRETVKELKLGLYVEMAIQTSRAASRPLRGLHSVETVKKHLENIRHIQEREILCAAEKKRGYVRRGEERRQMIEEDHQSAFIESVERRIRREHNATLTELRERKKKEVFCIYLSVYLSHLIHYTPPPTRYTPHRRRRRVGGCAQLKYGVLRVRKKLKRLWSAWK